MPRKKKGTNRKDSGGAAELQQRSESHKEAVTLARQSSKNAPKSMDVLPINDKFAQHYEQSKRRQLLSNAPPAILDQSDESSSSEEEEDEFGELLTKAIDRRVNETLEAIRKKDPRIYDKNAKFFEDVNERSENSDAASDVEGNSEDEPVAGWDTIAKSAEEATPKLTLKDYVRETLLSNGKLSDYDDGESDLEEERDDSLETSERSRIETKSHGEKIAPEKVRGNLIDNDDNDESDDNGSHEEDFFTKKEKTADDLEEEEKDFEVFMKKRAAKTSKQVGEDLLLHSYLEKETPDEKERFLRDFVLNNGWLDKNTGDAPAAHDYEIEIDTNDPDGTAQDPEDEDEFDDEVDNFEAQYNFRFEDPEGTEIVSHARNVPDSMRRPDTRRKRAREARRLRKEQERAEKSEELKHLKNLKKKEIQSRLLAIQEAAGDGVDLTGIDLEGDFDPDTFDKQMESKFNDEYYSMKDEQMKEVGKEGMKEGMSHASQKQILSKDRDDLPDDIREDVKRMTDEYYNLDFEDIVGGVPMRFKYKKVEPESFNMTADDILNADDKELNRLVSLKYLAPYRSKRDAQKQAWKVRAALQKRKKAKSVHPIEEKEVGDDNAAQETPVGAQDGDASAYGSRKRKRRKRKSKTDNLRRQNEEQATKAEEHVHVAEEDNDLRSLARTEAETEKEGTEVQDEATSRQRKKKKRKHKSRESAYQVQMSENRLKAYGITPS